MSDASDKTSKAADRPAAAERPADPRDRTPAKDNTPYQKADTSKTDADRVEEERVAASPAAAAARAAEVTRAEQAQASAADTAGESSNPDVHRLLAERQALETNRAGLVPSDAAKEQVKDIDKEIAAVDKQLAELGYPQS